MRAFHLFTILIAFLLIACDSTPSIDPTSINTASPTSTSIPSATPTLTPTATSTATPTPLAGISSSNIQKLGLASEYGYGYVSKMDWAPSGETIAIVLSTGKIQFLDIKTFTLSELEGTDNVSAITYSPEGEMLAIGYESGEVEFWSVENKLASQSFKWFENPVLQIVFSKDGKLMATRDHSTVLVWDLPSSLQLGSFTVAANDRLQNIDLVDIDEVDMLRINIHDSFRNVVLGYWDIASWERTTKQTIRLDTVTTFNETDEGFNAITKSFNSNVILIEDETLYSLPFDSSGFNRVQTEDGIEMQFESSYGIEIHSTDPATDPDTYLGQIVTDEFVKGVLFAPQAQRIILGLASRSMSNVTDKNRIEVYSLDTLELIHNLPGHNGMNSLELSPDETLLASAGKDGIRIWELYTGEMIWTLPDFTEHLNLSFLGETYLLSLGTADGRIGIINPFTSEIIIETDPQGRVYDLNFSSNGTQVVMSGEFGVRAYQLGQSKIDLIYENSDVVIGATAIEKSVLALEIEGITQNDGAITLHDLLSLKEWQIDFQYPIRPAFISFYQNANIVALAGPVFTGIGAPSAGVLVMNAADEGEGQELLTIPGYFSWDLSISVDNLLMAASSDNAIRIWELDNKNKGLFTLRGHQYEQPSLTFSPNNKLLASGGQGKIIVWDLETGLDLLTIETGDNAVKKITFSKDGNVLAAIMGDGRIDIWTIQ